YTSKLRFLACFCLVSAASATFFNNLLRNTQGGWSQGQPPFLIFCMAAQRVQQKGERAFT
ncbi:hypothetical protein, partial [Pseudomonas sp.]|uniref:hypothetical protein n=1 Tax=Pseudomonas sp. TaxID=306 RepID=UPI0027338DA6